MIEVSNGRLQLLFDEKNGAVRSIADRKKQIVLAENAGQEAFRLELEQEVFTSSFASFSYQQQGNSTILRWTLEEGITISAEIEAQEEAIAFSTRVENPSQRSLCSLEYPLLDGIKSLAGDADFVAHPFATGFLVQNPQESFEEEESGFRYMPYPECFSGASMQFFTYYSENRCGLYFAAYDGGYHQKWLNFYKKNNALRASHIFGYEDVGNGKPLVMDWKFVVQATEGKDWQEACDLYSVWAHRQEWCGKGKLKDIPETEKASWLLEETGAATFGINGMHDRTRWIRKYHEALKTPIFHVTGPDWPKETQSYGSGIPGGYADWFPTRFSRENIEAWRELGDHFAPFEFDFLIATDKSDTQTVRESLQVWPKQPKSCDRYHFSMLCPICGYTKKLHTDRDREVIRESGADAMYYDISANNILKTCMSEEHGHPAGAGSEMTKAYRSIYRETKEALSQEKGRYVPLGTEMINETLIDVLDYYQARANAQPCSALETWPYRSLIQDGHALVIPMFQYVYGEYAPMRLDGWGKLVSEGGDLIYHTIAKTYLWGGLFEINSEYSPMEVIDEYGENPSDEHYCELQPRGFRFDEEIAAYLARFAALRVGRLGRFLRYGKMQRTPQIDCRYTSRNYFQYNHANSPEQNSRGVVSRESVAASQYQLEGETALFLANTTAFTETISMQGEFLRPDADYRVTRMGNENSEQTAGGNQLESIELAPYEILVIRQAD